VKRVRVRISGRVQGVFFRTSCAGRARSQGVAGFVRNLSDGRVEAAFEGSGSAVDAMVEWCRSGPPGATVERVDTAAEDLTGEAGFHIVG
jgi:acylphosphatase